MHLRSFRHVIDAIDAHFSYAYQSERPLMCEEWKPTREIHRHGGNSAAIPHRSLNEAAHKRRER